MHSLDALSQYPNIDFPENRTEGSGFLDKKWLLIWPGNPSEDFIGLYYHGLPDEIMPGIIRHFYHKFFVAYFCRPFWSTIFIFKAF